MSCTTGPGPSSELECVSSVSSGHELGYFPDEGHSGRASGYSSAVDGPYSCGGVIVRCHVRV